ncbi:DUF1684 domain-containing protein [Paenibacillus urinalis]|uniref:DUF1684 domain-containing protein n=1 Tax=Paenibacillus urinalis TaxID=521520 RepID=UPI0019616755
MIDILTWRAERERSVAEFQGDLALVKLHFVQGTTTFEDIPGVWEPLASGTPGLKLTAATADGLTIEGKPVDGTVILEADHTIVRLSERITLVATSQPGSDHLLAVYDAKSDAVQEYEGLSVFPYDSSWCMTGTYIQEEEGRTAAFAHVSDQEGAGRMHQSPGDIHFEYEGATYRLTPFASGDALVIVFGDRTNGQETYGMGRMVNVTPEANGTVQLDFNYAYLPPCAFSPHFNCPMPPAHNRLPFRITAGEKQVQFRE